MLKNTNNCEAMSCSCRTKAEALARSCNNRIWQCTWNKAGDGEESKMPNPEDEEFFDASPSPVEEEAACRRGDCSAASEAGKAKLFELLQQHAVDDAMDVFYDVTDSAETTNILHKKVNLNNDCLSDSLMKINGMDKFQTSTLNETVESSHCYNDSHHSIQKENIVCNEKQNNDCPNGIDGTENSLDCEYEKKISKDIHCSTISPSLSEELSNEISLRCHISDGSQFFNGYAFSEDNSLPIYDKLPDQINSKADLKNDCQFISTPENRHFESNDEQYNSSQEKNRVSSKLDSKAHEQNISPVQSKKLSVKNGLSDDLNYPDSHKLSVFDETRPLISRSTSLKTGKTPPGTPSRKKYVRFADVFGLDLEDVRRFISGEVPQIPQSAFSDLDLADEDKPTQTSRTVELKGRQPWESIQSVAGPNILYPRFTIPGQQPGFWDKVRAQGICLESVTISDFNIQCTCRVMNWGFNKTVQARYTVNNWMSSTDINASYVSGSTQFGTDCFAFNIFLTSSCKDVQFALRYEINGKEHWDNNSGQNYCLSCHSITNTLQATLPNSPSWADNFW